MLASRRKHQRVLARGDAADRNILAPVLPFLGERAFGAALLDLPGGSGYIQRTVRNLLPHLIYILIRALCATLRFEVEDRCGMTRGGLPCPLIVILWHNRILVAPFIYRRFRQAYPGSVLTSASKDGDILADVIGKFRMGAVRGSSSRRGGAAMRELVSVIEGGSDIAITPDGPRGPVYRFSPGAVKVAQMSGAPLMPFAIEYSRYWELRSWDRFRIPKPFARVRVVFGPLQRVAAPAGAGPGAGPTDEAWFESERARIEGAIAAEISGAY